MIEKLLTNISRNLDKNKIPYMIIGGQAVLLYGRPRLTRDIDITLGVDSDAFSPIEKICKDLKLKILPENPQDFAEQTRVLPAEDPKSRIRLDFIFSFTDYETRAIERAKKVLINDYPVKFASCEDVIIHKMLAARAVDIEDIKSILIKNRDSIDTEYIEGWLSELSELAEHEQILKKFKSLLKR